MPPWEDQCEWYRMARMTAGPDCAVMDNLISGLDNIGYSLVFLDKIEYGSFHAREGSGETFARISNRFVCSDKTGYKSGQNRVHHGVQNRALPKLSPHMYVFVFVYLLGRK